MFCKSRCFKTSPYTAVVFGCISLRVKCFFLTNLRNSLTECALLDTYQ